MHAVVSAVTLLSSAPSAAVVYTVTYSGTARNVYATGAYQSIFGAAHDGDPISVKFTVDTAKGIRTESLPTELYYDRVDADLTKNPVVPTSPIVTIGGAILTFNDTIAIHSTTPIGTDIAEALSGVNSYRNTSREYQGYLATGEAEYVSFNFYPNAAGLPIDPYVFAVPLDRPLDIALNYSVPTVIGGFGGQLSDPTRQFLVGEYRVDMLAGRITVAGVPDTASWALMVAGFGVLGTALRRHRRGLEAAAPTAAALPTTI